MTLRLEADPVVLARWAEAWAISRGAAIPVPRDGGLYIHVGQPEQVGRYIFARLDREPIRDLAARIDRPLLYLKVCAPAHAVRPLLPPGWEIATPGYMMTAAVAAMLDRPPELPDGFAIYIARNGAVTFATIADPAGDEAARGRIIAMDDLVVFDRIRTAEAHQRRGLGSAIMRALAAEADMCGIRDAMLCATPLGRALYESLGWSLHSDYTTASLAP
ncbi:MAG: GNAT family N-acetyltransferase [Sphingomonas sp.]